MDLEFIKINENYDQDVEDLILDQFKDKEIYLSFVSAIRDIQKDFEKLLVDLGEQRRLPLASGEQLTDIGRELGIIRTTEDDNDYRAAIYLAAYKKNANGTRDEIASALYQISGFMPFIYVGLSRAVEITLNGEILPSNETLQEIIKILPINTSYNIGQAPFESDPFGFDGDDTCGGFGSVNQLDDSTVGGFCSLRAYILPPKRGPVAYVVRGYVEEGYVS